MPSRLMLIFCACLLPVLAVACGGDDDAAASKSPGGERSNPSSSPILTQPASRFAISHDDLVPTGTAPDSGEGYLTDLLATFKLDLKNYAGTKTFDSRADGEALLAKWGYTGGYETGYEPETRMLGVLNGAYFINLEVHLFKDEDGAKEAYKYFEERLAKSGSQKVTSAIVGNQSSAWKRVGGKVNESSVDAAYHRIVLRRGNLVAVVQTYGSDALMTVNVVHDLAALVDDKALGKAPAIEPTAVPSAANPTPTAAK